MTRALPLALAVLACGCSPLIGLLVRVGQSEGSEIRVGESATGSTRGAGDRFAPACGAPDGGGDRAYAFVPETTGVYRVEVDGDYDCVVAVFDEAGGALACNDDAGSTSHSMVELALEAGRRYHLVVDGYRGSTGEYTLRLTAVSTQPTPGPEVPAEGVLVLDQRREGDTTGLVDTRTPPCGAMPGSPEQTWRFTPTETGRHIVDVDSTFDGVLAVYAPGVEAPLACNDDHGSTRASQAIVDLTAGQTYEIVVDGYRGGVGTYGVIVRREGGPGPSQPGQAILLGTPTRGDTRRGSDQHQPGCGSQPGARDETWLFTPPQSGAYLIHVDAEFDSVLAVHESGQRQPLQCNDDYGSTRRSRLTMRLEAGRTYEVVVDGYATNEGEYMVSVTGVTSQAGGMLRVGPPVAGNTAAGSDQRTPTCGSVVGSPDESWTLTVPRTAQYAVQVDADFDSVVAIYDAQGAELACNDDHGTTQASRVETTLTAGTTVTVVVDGFQGAVGGYRLRVLPTIATGVPPTPTPTPTPSLPPLSVENITAMETRCAAAPALSPGLVAGRVTAADAAARTMCGGGSGGDAVYTVQVPVESTLTVAVESSLQPVLELRTACSRGHTAVACEAASNDPSRTTLSARLEPNRAYVLVVDTVRAGDATFTLDVAITPVASP